jgi:hypothetical protein
VPAFILGFRHLFGWLHVGLLRVVGVRVRFSVPSLQRSDWNERVRVNARHLTTPSF